MCRPPAVCRLPTSCCCCPPAGASLHFRHRAVPFHCRPRALSRRCAAFLQSCCRLARRGCHPVRPSCRTPLHCPGAAQRDTPRHPLTVAPRGETPFDYRRRAAPPCRVLLLLAPTPACGLERGIGSQARGGGGSRRDGTRRRGRERRRAGKQERQRTGYGGHTVSFRSRKKGRLGVIRKG